MTTSLPQPSHYLLRGGILLKRDAVESEPGSPKTIHYSHTIRMINGRSCDHENEIEVLKQRFEKQLAEKNQEIERLAFLLNQKEILLQVKNQEIAKLKAREGQNCLNKTQISSESQLPFIENIQNPQLYRPGLVDSVSLVLPDISEALSPQILKVKQQMRSTLQALNNITNNLSKPKRKYQFYHHFDKDTAKGKVITFDEEKENETRLYENQNELNSTFIEIVDVSRVHQPQLGKGRDSDLDQTFDDDRQDNVTFLQRIMKEHIKLKQTLIELQQTTRVERQQMKIYYENEIQAYIDMLNKQGEKGNEFYLNSTRTNIDQDNEQANSYSEQEENEQYFQWGKDHRFQIIFPQEEVLAPDIIE